MANRRMFNKELVSSDKFLDMPISSQALFFHLGMNADDEGFVSSPKRISRGIGCSEDDIKILIAKQFVVSFDSGVIVIKEWDKHNQIRKDRFTPTIHNDEKALLQVVDITSAQPVDNQVATTGQPSIVKSSIVECSIVEINKDSSRCEHTIDLFDGVAKSENVKRDIPKEIYDYYKTFDNLKNHRSLTSEMTKAIKKFMKETSSIDEDCKKVIKKHSEVVSDSSTSDYPIQVRSIQELFGQKAYNASHLIGSEYLDDGKYGEGYAPRVQPKKQTPQEQARQREFKEPEIDIQSLMLN